MKKHFLFLIPLIFLSVGAKTNRADYDFNVVLDDSLKIISGYADIAYANNTGDVIESMNFHLTANMFLSESEFLKRKVSPLAEGYTRIDSVFEDSIRNDDFTTDYTMAYLKLATPILPYSSKKLRVFFTNKVPLPFLREGWAEGSYDISQWYPKVAVYSKSKWADFQTFKNSEFFNEYGDYSLTITLPENLFLFGTGVLCGNENEMKRIIFVSDSINSKNTDKKTSKDLKTLRYSASNVNDFAFSLMRDFRYISLSRDSLTVEIACRRSNYEKYKKHAESMFGIIDYFSEKYYPYPYKKITIADGLLTAGGGMEYPTFIVMGSLNAPEEFLNGAIKARYIEDILCHEAAHQWFYLISGSNEHEEPFMDEGFATFSELSYMESRYEEDNYISVLGKKFANLFDSHYNAYVNLQTNKMALPMNSKSTDAEEYFSYINFYSKGYMTVRAMESILGAKVFKEAMKGYFEKFAFTHPSIDDLFDHLNSFTENRHYEELKKLLYENAYTDYSVSMAKLANNSKAIVIKNKSSTDLPVKVSVEYADKTFQNFTKKVDFDTIYLARSDVKNVIVDKEMRYMDTYYHDNSLVRGLKVHLVPQMPDYFKDNLYFLPMIDYTLFDKFTYSISAYFCDLPKIEQELSLGKSNYGIRGDIGYNPMSSRPLFKLNAYSEQGDVVRTGVQIDFKSAKNYYKVSPSLYAYRLGQSASYKFRVSFMSRSPLDTSSYYSNGFTDKDVRGLEAGFSGLSSKNKLAFRYSVFSFIYDPLFYSEVTSAGIDLSGNISYRVSGIELKGGVNSSFVYRERNAETSLHLFKDGFSLFDSYSKPLGDHLFEAFYFNEGFFFVTDDTTSYKALNRLRVSAGNVLYAYSDFILAGNYRDGRRLMQSGLLLNFAEIVRIEIPFYNTERGLLLHDRFVIGLNIDLLKVI